MKKGWSEIKSHKEICVYGQPQTKLEEEELIHQREIEEQQNILAEGHPENENEDVEAMTLSELLALELGLPEQSNQEFEQQVEREFFLHYQYTVS